MMYFSRMVRMAATHVVAERLITQRLMATRLVILCVMMMTFALTVGCLVPLGTLGAQSHFQNPKDEIAYDTYQAIYECDAAILRVLDSADRAAAIWQDTLPWSEAEFRVPLPEIVVSVANRCAKLPSHKDWSKPRERETLLEWLRIMLIRGDTAAVADGLRRGLAEEQFDYPGAAISELGRILGIFVTIPQRPFPRDDVFEHFMQRQRLSAGDKLRTLHSVLRVAFLRADWDVLTSLGRRGEGLIDSLDSAERADTSLHAVVASILTLRASRELDDSLETGGRAAYIRHLNTVLSPLISRGWMRLREESATMARSSGSRAMPIEAAYWYPEKPPNEVPTPGKISILVFMDVNSYFDKARGGMVEPIGFFYTLRRLKQRFPSIDITVIAATGGWFGHAPPLSVRDEGEMFRRWLLDARQFPGRLAVDSTPFYRLPGYDRRRVNMRSVNRENYTFVSEPANFLRERELTVTEERDNPTAYVVDMDGTIMARGISRRTEPDIARLIRAMQRERDQHTKH